jgi:hypothetical protein
MNESMPAEWFHAAPEGPAGPRTADEIDALIRAGEIGAETLVWRRPMELWAPAHSRAEFAAYFAPVVAAGPVDAWEPAPVAAPQRVAVPRVYSPVPGIQSLPPRPWLRLGARALDSLLIWTLVTFVAERLELPGTGPVGSYLLGLVTASAVALLFVPRWGTTPGKWLLSTRLVRDGSLPTPSQVLSRETLVVVRGEGLSIPILSLLTHLRAYETLTDNGRSSWDADLGLHVIHEPLRAGRLAVLLLVLAGFAALFVDALR